MANIKVVNQSAVSAWFTVISGNPFMGVTGGSFEDPSTVANAKMINASGGSSTWSGNKSGNQFTLSISTGLGSLGFPKNIIGGFGPFTPGSGIQITVGSKKIHGKDTFTFKAS